MARILPSSLNTYKRSWYDQVSAVLEFQPDAQVLKVRLIQTLARMPEQDLTIFRFFGGTPEDYAGYIMRRDGSALLNDFESVRQDLISRQERRRGAIDIQRMVRGRAARRQYGPMLGNARQSAQESLTQGRDDDPYGYFDHDPSKGRFVFGNWLPYRSTDVTGPRRSATVIQFDSPEDAIGMPLRPQTTIPQTIIPEPMDELEDYNSPVIVPAGQVPDLARVPATTNRFWGNANVTLDNQVVEGNVPIFNVSVNIDITDERIDWPEVFQLAYTEAFQVLNSGPFELNWPSAYGQVRLVRFADLQYDVVTPMVPINDLNGEFTDTLEQALQSQNSDVQPTTEELLFRFTFVFPNGAAITPNIVTRAARLFRQLPDGNQLPLNTFATTRRFNLMEESRASGTIHALNRQQLHRQVNREYIQQMTPEQRKERRVAYKRSREERGLTSPRTTPISQERRSEYNRRRREKYQQKRGRTEVRGVYDDLKKRIFHHSSLSQFFECSKAVLTVPNTHKEGYCLAMALLRSEIRTYMMKDYEVKESSVSQVPGEDHLPFPIGDTFETTLRNLGPFPFLAEIDGILHGFLFNAYRSKREGSEDILKYSPEPDREEVQAWYLVAQALHAFVESRYDRTIVPQIDPNIEEEALQAYSNVLGVHIAVYRLELQGQRSTVYSPEYLSPDLRLRDKVYVTSILISEGHATCITNLREFLKSKTTANRSNVNNYCLFCEKLSTANNESLEKAKQHFQECCGEHGGVLSGRGDRVIKSKMINHYNAIQFQFRAKYRDYICRTCNQTVDDIAAQYEHVCYIQKPEKLPMGDSKEVYVYDFECAQIFDALNHVYDHRVNLVCLRRAYSLDGDEDRHCFTNLETFMAFVMSKTSEKRIYLAHNGGRYDVQFVMRYLEKNLIPHSFVTAPSSIHAYLSVTISFGASCEATFLDFRNFMPGSLKNIGTSFGLEVTKGVFPHHFNNGFHDHYVGALPPCTGEKDYWCIKSMRTEEETEAFRQWYSEQTGIFCTCEDECVCDKQKWDFQEQIQLYCWLDVDVLAEAVRKYRDNALAFGLGLDEDTQWESKGIDPFQYVTIPQMAVNLLLSGLPASEVITITPPKRRVDRCPLAIAWMERINRELGYKIKHIGNSNKEFYCLKTNRFLDGVDIRRGQYFVCLDCEFHACPECFYDENESGQDHPCRPGTYSMVYKDTTKFLQTLMKTYGISNVHVTWSHALQNYSEYEQTLGNIMGDRDMFYGGRTEVFSPFCNASFYPEDEIKYHDVCSLYPYVCAFKPLPTGEPKHICGLSIDRERITNLHHPRPYFGYVRCKVVPRRGDILGLLPFRDPVTKRLDFPLLPMVGSWGTEELRLALENGYEVQEIYEVYHWSEDERSNTALRGYVAFFLRMKQEAEGWRKLGASSDNPSEEEKDEIVEKVFNENGRISRIRKEEVCKNPVKRQMAKLFLNSLWGKFCQKPNKDSYVTIYGYKQFANLWFNPEIDKTKFSFRLLSGNTWKVKYSFLDSFARPNVKYNIFLASKVTEWARCILHRQMIRIGPSRVLYCDTDSIMFLWPKCAENLSGCGLGNWVDEYPREVIQRLYAISPKFYYLVFASGDNLLKSKGIQMTLENANNLKEQKLGRQLLELLYPRVNAEGEKLPFENYMYMKNMIIGVNSTNSRLAYGSMLTRYTEDKKVAPTFTKRNLVTFPASHYDLSTLSIDEVPRIFTIAKNYEIDLETFSDYLARNHFFLYINEVM